MAHQLRAEYGPRGRSGEPVRWHVVRSAAPDVAMCGRELDADAETRTEEAWGVVGPTCQQCGSLYLHEVPFLPADWS